MPDLRELYARPYDARMNQWRLVCARDKADHIEDLCTSLEHRIESVLEVGCGTGVVLQELAARHLGRFFTGIEIGTERAKSSGSGDRVQNLSIHGYDGKTIPYDNDSFDLVYATHVLEHVTEERAFLLELRRVARHYIYVEVPCELTVRSSHESIQSTLSIGHINAYTIQSFALTLETSGMRLLKLDVFDHSYKVYRFLANWCKAVFQMLLRRSLLAMNKRVAAFVFAYHVGAVCEKAAPLTID